MNFEKNITGLLGEKDELIKNLSETHSQINVLT